MPNQAETCGMWRVTDASLFATTLFLLPNFFQKEILKIEIEFFSGFQSPEVRKLPDF
jgi:hypothetical protein